MVTLSSRVTVPQLRLSRDTVEDTWSIMCTMQAPVRESAEKDEEPAETLPR